MLLYTGKIEVDSEDSTGRTPLSWAAQNGNKAAVKMLLMTGNVDVDLNDIYSRTPLSWAGSGNRAVVKLLLETGQVEVDLKDKYGQTPLLYAAAFLIEARVKLLLGTTPYPLV